MLFGISTLVCNLWVKTHCFLLIVLVNEYFFVSELEFELLLPKPPQTAPWILSERFSTGPVYANGHLGKETRSLDFHAIWALLGRWWYPVDTTLAVLLGCWFYISTISLHSIQCQSLTYERHKIILSCEEMLRQNINNEWEEYLSNLL